MLSIIICTHNRADILGYCLGSFASQSAESDVFEVIVVDNHSMDGTREVVENFRSQLPHLRYVYEEMEGLSYARNRGYFEARYDWVSYVDDDAKAYPDYVARVIDVINSQSFDCFGGRFFPWYLQQKPKWLPDDFGLFPKWLNEVGELPANRTVAGGVMVLRKSALADVGGFPMNLGMRGSKVGYGEENWVQAELRSRSYKIGFDPELKIDHLVAPYKFRLRWHLQRLYAKGRDGRILDRNGAGNAAFLLTKALVFTVRQFFVNSLKWLTRHHYYYQNFVLDSFGFLVQTIGAVGVKKEKLRRDA